MKRIDIHLVSDATGDTARAIARACLVQFEELEVNEHYWVLVRTRSQMENMISGLEQDPGPVICSMVDDRLRPMLEDACRRLGVPFVPVLDAIMAALKGASGLAARNLPGRQHVMDSRYFDRIDAMQFATQHDDGQATWNLEQADIVLVGVSRTSKTPTCVYLANRGVKAANVPFVPGVPLPPEVRNLQHPLVVGLTVDPARLVQIRRNRLLMLEADDETDYVDIDAVKQEVIEARRVFTRHHWPIIDVTRRSIEETAAAMMQLLSQRETAVRHAGDN